MKLNLLIGRTLSFSSDPFTVEPDDAADYIADGAVLLGGNKIADVGSRESLLDKYPNALRHPYSNSLIVAGFIDSHAHFPQTGIIATWGKRLLDWLNDHTFPEESRFSDNEYSRQVAERYLDLITVNGTTTVCTYCTVHPESVNAFFAAAESIGMRALAGKTCMDRNAPPELLDTAISAYDDSKRLLNKWHSRNRLSYVITPRFAPTSSPEQMEMLGNLWSEFPECLMQTHLSEQTEELQLVQKLFPRAKDYLDVYEKFNLTGKGALFGHALHLSESERQRLLESGSAVVHCPTSNLFFGSGLFDMHGLKSYGLPVGLATDTGGGSSFSMFRTMAAAYEVSQLNRAPLHPAQLIWLATGGNAKVLGLQSLIGNLQRGMEADVVVIDLYSTAAIEQRTKRAKNIWEELFPTIMMGDERAIAAVWIAGRNINHRSSYRWTPDSS